MRDSNGRFSLVEINPRFPASMNLTVAAGVNLPLHLIEISRNEFERNPRKMYDYMSFTPNLMLVRCHKNYYWSTESDDISFTGDPGFVRKKRKSYQANLGVFIPYGMFSKLSAFCRWDIFWYRR